MYIVYSLNGTKWVGEKVSLFPTHFPVSQFLSVNSYYHFPLIFPETSLCRYTPACIYTFLFHTDSISV